MVNHDEPLTEQLRAPTRLQVRDNTLALSGEISFHTVNSILVAGRAALGALSAAQVVLDLSAVTKSDSAGLALVVDWVRTAKQHGAQLRIVGVSAQLADIARVSGLEDFLAGDR